MIVSNFTNFAAFNQKSFKNTTLNESPSNSSRMNSLELPNFTYNQLMIKKSKVSFGISCEPFTVLSREIEALEPGKSLIIGDIRHHLSEIGRHLIPYSEEVHRGAIVIKDIPSMTRVARYDKTPDGKVLVSKIGDASGNHDANYYHYLRSSITPASI